MTPLSPVPGAIASPRRRDYRGLRPDLPTMYDLPSENPEDPGLPDEFHDFQPELLRRTFRPPAYWPDRCFSGSDLNIYYDLDHLNWYKRPDWFGVVDVDCFYGGDDLRQSYVRWQEGADPTVVVELLSPGTEPEDLGQTQRRRPQQPPTKWEVYEQILRVPYYVVFDRDSLTLQAFAHDGQRLRPLTLTEPRLWIPTLELGLGLWRGTYSTGRARVSGQWLRWYDAQGQWLPTDTEAAQQEAQLAQQEAQLAQQEVQLAQQEVQLAQERAMFAEERARLAEDQAARLAAKLRELNIDPDAL
nr:Uma2 family endonuclease [Prochlorothrix hollandica]